MDLQPFRWPGRRRMLALTVPLVSAAVLAAPAAAEASTQAAARPAAPAQISNCPQYSLCLWQNSGYGGNMWAWENSKFPKDTDIWVGGSANDQASSYFNDRDDISGIAKNYPVKSGDRDYQSLSSGAEAYNLAGQDWPDGSGMNDSVSSIQLTSVG